MTEDDLRIKWGMDDPDEQRRKRMEYVKGHYINCKHHGKTVKGVFDCQGYKRTSCEGCSICPNCGGRIAYYRRQYSRYRDVVHMRQESTCILCGAYISHERIERIPSQGKSLPGERLVKCEVEGCRDTAYEGHKHEDIDGSGNMRTWIICETHHRRIKSWRYNNNKGAGQIPVIPKGTILTDNPAYWKKTR